MSAAMKKLQYIFTWCKRLLSKRRHHNISKNSTGHKSNTGQSTSANLVPVKSAPYRGSIVFKYRVVTEGQSACADTDLFIVPVRHKWLSVDRSMGPLKENRICLSPYCIVFEGIKPAVYCSRSSSDELADWYKLLGSFTALLRPLASVLT